MSTSSPPSGYSGTPLPKKLGIKPDSVTWLIDAPEGAAEKTFPLPEGAQLRQKVRSSLADDGSPPQLGLWFVRTLETLDESITAVAAACPHGLWILWIKRASGIPTDVTEDLVRNFGLAIGLVDYKVCAFDEQWSGLKFAWRKGT